jgi:hypothetical protein
VDVVARWVVFWSNILPTLQLPSSVALVQAGVRLNQYFAGTDQERSRAEQSGTATVYSFRPRKFRPVAATLMFEVPETMLAPQFTLRDKGSYVLSGGLGSKFASA